MNFSDVPEDKRWTEVGLYVGLFEWYDLCTEEVPNLYLDSMTKVKS